MSDYEEAVEPQAEPIEQIMDDAEAEMPDQIEQDNESNEETHEKTMVPLSALQKLREKKKELELQLQWEQQRNAQYMQYAQPAAKPAEPEDDNSRYESATREDLNRSHEELMRKVEESLWAKANREKQAYVDENLPNFLKQRPNLTQAIQQSANRYEEAYTLMTALSPKEQKQLRETPPQATKKVAPNSPGGIPKSAALNSAVDVMSMNDEDFAKWRDSKRKRR